MMEWIFINKKQIALFLTVSILYAILFISIFRFRLTQYNDFIIEQTLLKPPGFLSIVTNKKN